MVCERFFTQDFTPRQNFRDPGESTVPDAWPITYEQMSPWYAEEEKILGVRGQPDPLRPEAAAVGLPAPPPFPPDNQPPVNCLTGRGLHPVSLADGLRLHRWVPYLSGLSVPSAVQGRVRPQPRTAHDYRIWRPPACRLPGGAPRG